MLNKALLTLTLLAAAGCGEATKSISPKEAPYSRSVGTQTGVIVTLKSGESRKAAKSMGLTPYRWFHHALNGFAVALTEPQIAALAKNPNVKSIEPDVKVTLADVQLSPRQGLDRIDQRTTAFDGQYIYDRTGIGVDAWIIDTGIRATHSEFTGRVGVGVDFTGLGSTDDCNGHGSHVAGILGGTVFGVAKGVTLHPLRVFPPCADTTSESTVIAAVDWVTGNATLPAVVNMSIEGPLSSALNTAVANSIAAGFTYTVAAGNDNSDACNYSPASVAGALTVGNALVTATLVDKRDGTSNFGNCVDFFAPGYVVQSAWITSDTATAYLSGTSMSAPHAAGVAAMYLQGRPTASPAEVSDSLKAYTTRSVVTLSNSANCNLLFSGRAVQGGHIGRCPK